MAKIKLTEEQMSQAETMSGYGLTQDQIAHLLGLSVITFKRRVSDTPELAMRLQRGKAKVHLSLAQKAIKMANEGNIALLIFILKTKFGYRERDYLDVSGKIEVNHEHQLVNKLTALNDDQLENRIIELEKYETKLLNGKVAEIYGEEPTVED